MSYSVERISQNAIRGAWTRSYGQNKMARMLIERHGLNRPDLDVGNKSGEYDFVSSSPGVQEDAAEIEFKRMKVHKVRHSVKRLTEGLEIPKSALQSEFNLRFRKLEKEADKTALAFESWIKKKVVNLLQGNTKAYDGKSLFLGSGAGERKGGVNKIQVDVSKAVANAKSDNTEVLGAEQWLYVLDEGVASLLDIQNENSDYTNDGVTQFSVIGPSRSVRRMKGSASSTQAGLGVENWLSHSNVDFAFTGFPELNPASGANPKVYMIADGRDEPWQHTLSRIEDKDLTDDDLWFNKEVQRHGFSTYWGITPLSWASILEIEIINSATP